MRNATVPRLTTACTRPPTRELSSVSRGAGRRVMPGVMRSLLARENSGEPRGRKYRSSVQEVREDVLFILWSGCRAGLELL